MREIKFRAWDKEHQFMDYTDKDLRVDFSGSGVYIVNSKGDFNEPILMQYTGLKDKNGIETYEGDIVKVECECGFVGNATVEYKHNAFRLNYPYQHRFSSGELEFNRMNRVEVIGNIYENPELLEVNNGS